MVSIIIMIVIIMASQLGPTWPGQSTALESAEAIYLHLYFNSLPPSPQLKQLPGVLEFSVARGSK